MNSYLIFVGGLMISPDAVNCTVSTGNSIVNGAYADVSVDRVWLRGERPAPWSMDVIELRGGSMVRRYHCHEVLDDREDKSVVFRCLSVPNMF